MGSFTVPSRGSILLKRVSGARIAEVSVSVVVVDLEGDKRIRATVSGGLNKAIYRIQLTAATAEGRVLEDEFVLKVKGRLEMRLFANNASSTLASPISNSALSMTVASGEGARFPSPGLATTLTLHFAR